jgi:preprotein translocase subunit SecD
MTRTAWLRWAGAAATIQLACAGCATLSARGPGDTNVPPVAVRFHLAASEPREGYGEAADENGQLFYVDPEPLLTERDVARAAVLRSDRRNVVLLEFAPHGADVLDETSAAHLGDRLAIFIDDQLVMSPRMQSRITKGKAAISGGFSDARAAEIVRGLNAPRSVARPDHE